MEVNKLTDDYFYNYIMDCIEPNEVLFSVQHLCNTCSNNLGNDDCYFWQDIKSCAHDDKGNNIICSCSSYYK